MLKKPPRHQPLRALGDRKKSARPDTPSEPSFADAALRDGTVPLGEKPRRIAPPRSRALAAPATRALPEFSVETDEEWVEGHRTGEPAAGRRLGDTPEATLDLHGYDTESARQELAAFLRAERERGRALVLIVVGKGRRSPGGYGVLRQEISGWLTSAPCATHVLAFRTAPRELGGSGGVLVRLTRAGTGFR